MAEEEGYPVAFPLAQHEIARLPELFIILVCLSHLRDGRQLWPPGIGLIVDFIETRYSF